MSRIPSKEECNRVDQARLQQLMDEVITRTRDNDTSVHSVLLLTLEAPRKKLYAGKNPSTDHSVFIAFASENQEPENLHTVYRYLIRVAGSSKEAQRLVKEEVLMGKSRGGYPQ